MHFTQFNIGRMKDDYSTKEVSKEVVTKEIVYKPDSVIKQFTKVKALITTTSRTMFSEGILNLTVRNNHGLVLWNDNITSNSGWSTQFSTYTGDERALSDEDKNLINKARENPPHEDEIIGCLKESMYTDFVSRLRNHYSHY
jgi:hypothetical protein